MALTVGIIGTLAAGMAMTSSDAPASPPPLPAEPAIRPEPIFAEPQAATVELFASLQSTDSVQDLLVRSGAPKTDAAQVANLLRDNLPGGVGEGTEVAMLLGERIAKNARRLERLNFQPSPSFKILIGRTAAGDLKLVREALAVDATPQRFRGRAGSDLFWALRAAGVPAASARDYLEALSSQVDLRSIRPEEEFDLVIDALRPNGGKAQFGSLLYAGLRKAEGREVGLVRWTIDGEQDWFDPSRPQQRVEGMKAPVSGSVTSGFGYRIHPILRFGRFHQGVDYGAAWGSPVFAADDGLVAGAGWNGGYGRQVSLAHAGGVSTSYSHLSRMLVAPGARIRRGDLVGLVGSSGFSTGPHLHFEVHRFGQPVNPSDFRQAKIRTVSKSDVSAARARLEQLRSI